MMERLCATSEIGASYLVSKRYVQEVHYQQELLHYRELGSPDKPGGIKHIAL